jgi:N-acetylglucosaminyldiphosphoundecaprenol N-acetyl-beta-D-mannosaminyltransferase
MGTDSRRVAHVLGVDVDAVDMEEALGHVAAFLQGCRKNYVCVTGVHGIMEAQRDSRLLEVYSRSAMTIPDGMPVAWIGRLQGHTGMQRVTGPDLMLEVFRREEFAQTTHFFYGGREGIATELRDKLRLQFPWVKIVGTYTPPFRELSSSERDELIGNIAALKPDIIWVGIGCPKQEIFMAEYLPALETKLMFGVGAAFDFHTGRIRDCADWIKRSGLQWLHRLLQDPKRLWRRYLSANPAFLWLITLQILNVRSYPRCSENTGTKQRRIQARPSRFGQPGRAKGATPSTPSSCAPSPVRQNRDNELTNV